MTNERTFTEAEVRAATKAAVSETISGLAEALRPIAGAAEAMDRFMEGAVKREGGMTNGTSKEAQGETDGLALKAVGVAMEAMKPLAEVCEKMNRVIEASASKEDGCRVTLTRAAAGRPLPAGFVKGPSEYEVMNDHTVRATEVLKQVWAESSACGKESEPFPFGLYNPAEVERRLNHALPDWRDRLKEMVQANRPTPTGTPETMLSKRAERCRACVEALSGATAQAFNLPAGTGHLVTLGALAELLSFKMEAGGWALGYGDKVFEKFVGLMELVGH